MKKIDARGLSCPEPVILTKNALNDKENEYEIYVDNYAAKENVTRFCEYNGFSVNVTKKEDDFILEIKK